MNSNSKGKVVVGIGGNSLITGEDRQSINHQFAAVEDIVSNIVDADELGWNIIITHGNGPQVGFVLERSELAAPEVITIPIDYAVADIQGAVGYMFVRAFDNEYSHRNMDKNAVAIITRVLVDTNDKAFEDPSKPIGPFFGKAKAAEKVQNFSWNVKEDSGRGWRRVVACPEPLEIIELDQITDLIELDNTVIACGGGGIPVSRSGNGKLQGVEAVIDKDLASSLLASKLDADVLLLSTDVPKVAINYGTPKQKWLDSLTITEAEKLQKEDQFDAGSMGPKVEAMLWFLRNGGRHGVITNSENIAKSLDGRCGTQFFGS
jgi:carbamate kinase